MPTLTVQVCREVWSAVSDLNVWRTPMTSVLSRTGAASARRARLDEGNRYRICRHAVQPHMLRVALRRLNIEMPRTGLSPDQISAGIQGTFFPHVRWDPEVLALQDVASGIVKPEPGEQWADPQLVLRFPDEAESWPPQPHIDEVPPWAPDRRYVAIVGVAITRAPGSMTVALSCGHVRTAGTARRPHRWSWTPVTP